MLNSDQVQSALERYSQKDSLVDCRGGMKGKERLIDDWWIVYIDWEGDDFGSGMHTNWKLETIVLSEVN